MEQALAVFEPSHFFGEADTGVGVCAEADVALLFDDAGDVGKAIAEVGFGEWADADVAAGCEEVVHVGFCGVGAVNGGEHGVDGEVGIEQGHGRLAVVLEALLYFQRLLLDVHVEREVSAIGLLVQGLDDIEGSCADGVGDNAEGLGGGIDDLGEAIHLLPVFIG